MSGAPLPGTGLPDINRGPEILATCGAFTGVSFLFLAIRFYVRVKMTREVGWDDWFCLGSWLVVFIEMMLFIPEVHYGAGRHMAYIKPLSNVQKGLKINLVTQPLCLLALTLVKISIGLFLLRVTPCKRYATIVQGVIVFTCLACLSHILVVLLQCRPIQYTWGEGKGSCMPGSHLRFAAFFNTATIVLTDIIFALLPIPILYRLQVKSRVKFAICGILSLGLFATSAGFVKLHYLSLFGKHGDWLYDSTELTIWTTIETCTGIIAACFPCLKPLFQAARSTAHFFRTETTKHDALHNGHNRCERSGRATNNKDEFQMYGDDEGHNSKRRNLSDESILPIMTDDGGDGIIKTSHFSIRSERF